MIGIFIVTLSTNFTHIHGKTYSNLQAARDGKLKNHQLVHRLAIKAKTESKWSGQEYFFIFLFFSLSSLFIDKKIILQT